LRFLVLVTSSSLRRFCCSSRKLAFGTSSTKRRECLPSDKSANYAASSTPTRTTMKPSKPFERRCRRVESRLHGRGGRSSPVKIQQRFRKRLRALDPRKVSRVIDTDVGCAWKPLHQHGVCFADDVLLALEDQDRRRERHLSEEIVAKYLDRPVRSTP